MKTPAIEYHGNRPCLPTEAIKRISETAERAMGFWIPSLGKYIVRPRINRQWNEVWPGEKAWENR